VHSSAALSKQNLDKELKDIHDIVKEGTSTNTLKENSFMTTAGTDLRNDTRGYAFTA
jgi:hypothetical protein